MADAFEDDRIVPFSTSAVVRIWQGTDDDIVLEVDTSPVVADLTEVGYTVLGGGGHTDVAFSDRMRCAEFLTGSDVRPHQGCGLARLADSVSTVGWL